MELRQLVQLQEIQLQAKSAALGRVGPDVAQDAGRDNDGQRSSEEEQSSLSTRVRPTRRLQGQVLGTKAMPNTPPATPMDVDTVDNDEPP